MKYFLITFLFLFLLVPSALAESSVLINEFSVETTPQSVEFINPTATAINISHWYIDDNGGTSYFTIPDNTVVYPNSCLVFSADFNLNKSTPDTVRVFDSTAPPTSPTAKLIDSYSYSVAPAVGLNYARIPDATSTWASVTPSLGQYNSNRFPCLILPTIIPLPTVTPTLTQISLTPTILPSVKPTPTPTISPTPEIPHNIYVSEAMVNPETGTNEWVELYNDNDEDVTLSNWLIDDIDNGGSSPKTFSLSIPAKGYAVYTLDSSMFNNDGDDIRLLDPIKNEEDRVIYTVAEKSKTVGRIDLTLSTLCNQQPSPGIENTSCAAIETITSTPTITPKVTPTIMPSRKPTSTSSRSAQVLGSTESNSSDTSTTDSLNSQYEVYTGQIKNITHPLSLQFLPVKSSSKDNNEESSTTQIFNKFTPYIKTLSFFALSLSILVILYSFIHISIKYRNRSLNVQ